MAALELRRSRAYHRSTGGEEQVRIYRIEGISTDAANYPGIAQIGDELEGRPELICVDVASAYFTTNDDGDYAQVTVKYSTEQALLVNPGDMKFDYNFNAKSEQLSFAPRVQHKAPRYPDGKKNGEYVKRAVGQFGDSISVFRPAYAVRVTKLFNYDMLQAVAPHLYTATGTVNRDVWRGYPANTMLFHGGDTPQTGHDRWIGNYLFTYDAGLHDYPWFKIDTNTKQIESKPYWSELYKTYDFSQLNMETPPV